ncbi:MarR family winged helix-turn-helix transcriptional regulator [Stappia sediminis]|nr:MarR family transcriptional regulator [Stappia sediminis]
MSQDGASKSSNDGALGAPIDTILEQWRRERPDIDPSPMAVCGDIWRAGERLRKGVMANLAGTGLDFACFDVVLTLRRQGRGGALSPSALAKEMMLSTSAMTSRLDRLEKLGLITRETDPADRRGLKVALTDAGFAKADEIVVSHVSTEERLLNRLSAKERDQLRSLLRKIGE